MKVTRSANISASPTNKSKVRIKQKSLAAIVARQLGQTIEPNESQILFNKQKSISDNFTKKNVEIPSGKSNFNSNDKLSSDSQAIVKFVKNTKENTNKPTVLKKKSSDSKDQKSLSDIFSTGSNKSDSNFSVSSLASPEILSKNESKSDSEIQKISTWKPKAQGTFQNKNNFGERKEKQIEYDKKRNKYREKNERTNKKSAGNNERVMKKPTGKISSLFGNNPEVLSMGQRFVKPVQEKVFSGINFSDLEIHAYSVRISMILFLFINRLIFCYWLLVVTGFIYQVSNLEQNMQITKMTTVQQKAIPQILSGKDVLIRSQTGSGKTLAYALPIVESLQKVTPKLSRSSGIKALVIVPTRELALQTYECFLKLIKVSYLIKYLIK